MNGYQNRNCWATSLHKITPIKPYSFYRDENLSRPSWLTFVPRFELDKLVLFGIFIGIMFQLNAEHIFKSFSFRQVLRDINFTLEDGDCLVITGRNGSGKSTLMKLLAGLLSPDSGRVDFQLDGNRLNKKNRKRYVGLVCPDVMLYDELTALENLKFLSSISGSDISRAELVERIKRAGLGNRENDLVGSYSTGMKQRIKLAFALLNQPKLLLLDEPNSNLDQDGQKLMENIIERQKQSGILILATNQLEQIKYGNKTLSLD